MKKLIAFLLLLTLCITTACTTGNGSHKHEYDGKTDAICNTCGYERSVKNLFSQGLAPIPQYNMGNLYGYINEEGKVVIEFQFLAAESFGENGLAAVQNKDYEWGFINTSGEYVIAPGEYDRIMSFSEGLAAVKKDGLWAFINEKGEFITDFIYYNTGDFTNGIAKVYLDHEWSTVGYIDKSGKLITDTLFTAGGDFGANGLAAVESNDEKWGYINTSGEFALEPSFEFLSSFDVNGIAMAMQNGKYGYINESFEFIIDPQFDLATPFGYSDLAAVQMNGKWGYIDRSGNMIIQPAFNTAYSFDHNGLAVVSQNEKWGVINREGAFVILPEYDYSDIAYRADLICMKKDGKCRYLDTNGKVVIDSDSTIAYSFDDIGLTVVHVDKNNSTKFGCIDRNGNEILPAEYKSVTVYSDGYVAYIYTPENKPQSFSALKIIRVSDGSTLLDLDPGKYQPSDNPT